MLKKTTFFRWLMALTLGIFLLSGAFAHAQDGRSLVGSYVDGLTDFYPLGGSNYALHFATHAVSTDSEWVVYAELDFPMGVTVVSATPMQASPAARILPFNGQAGDGALLSWGAMSGYGTNYLSNGNVANFSVVVNIGPDFEGDLTIDWMLHGDEWGADPHSVTGTVVVQEAIIPLPVGDVVAFPLNDNAVQVSWSGSGPPPPPPVIAEWINYDDGVNATNLGSNSGAYTIVWAVKFTPAQLAEFNSCAITKVSTFGGSGWSANTLMLKIWQGENRDVLIYEQDVLSIVQYNDTWTEIELPAAVEFDNSQSLWIGFDGSANATNFIAAAGNRVNLAETNADHLSFNGSAWNTLTGFGIPNLAWNIHTFVTNAFGRSMPITPIADVTDAKVTNPDATIGFVDNPDPQSTLNPNTLFSGRSISSYDVWREKVYQPGSLELLGSTTQGDFVDFGWGALDWGVYRWAVTVNYIDGQVSVPTFSNTLEKEMGTVVTMNVQTNSGDSPEETSVMFTNTSEPDLELVYEFTMPASGTIVRDDFRKGVYDIEVFKPGFVAHSYSGVEIFDETTFNWVLVEILAPPVDLYVTPTAFATWATGDEVPFEPFFEDFDEGIPDDWTIEEGETATVDDNWFLAQPTASQSITNTPYMRIDSDAAGSGGKFVHGSLYTPVIDASTAATLYLEFLQYYRHLGSSRGIVEVFDGNDWVEVLFQSATSGSWTAPNEQMIDVTEYANAQFQVRFEYYDGSSWAWYWAIDNVSVTDVPPSKQGREFEHYKVFLNNVLVTETTDLEYQFGTNGEVLVDGQTYLAEVAAVYSTGQSVKAPYTFTYIACDNYDVPGDFDVAQVEGTLNVALGWSIPVIDPGDDQIAFARIYRNGEVITELMGDSYLDANLAIGSYDYCITFVYESGAETCGDAVCASVTVTGNATVNGTIVQAPYLGGEPVEGATVMIYNDTESFSFTTNASGVYSGSVLAGTYDYEASADGYLSEMLEDVVIPEAGTVTQDFVLMEFPYPAGDVVAVELSDATVEISWRTPSAGFEPYFEDFEASDGGWVSGAISGADHWQWGTPAQTNVNGAYSGSNAWAIRLAANYDNNANTWLMRQFDFSRAVNPYFSVQILLHSEPGWDGMILEYSLNDGASWAKVMGDPGFYNNTSTFGPLPPPKWSGRFQSYQLFGSSIPEVAGEPNVWLRFRFASDGSVQDEGLAIDDVMIVDMPLVRSLTPPESTLAGYNVYRTSCEDGGNLQFMGYTLDTTFNDNTWGTAASGVYKWGVEAVYEENTSEIEFSNCLDKNMTTMVSVTVQTNSADSPEGATVLFVNTSEPDLGLTYSVELDASGYYLWEDFRKGTYDITVELLGFASIELTDVLINIPINFSWVLEELLLPIGDLHVTPTGYATWRAGGIIPFEPFMVDWTEGIDDWTRTPATANWQLSQTNLAGGVAPEVRFYWSPNTLDRFYFVSPMMSSLTQTQLELSFKHFVSHFSGAYTLQLITIADGVEYIVDEWVNPTGWAAQTYTTMLTSAHGVGAEEFQIGFVFDGQAWNINWWNIDDIMLYTPGSRELESYSVYLDGIFQGSTTDEFYQYETADLVEGQEYLAEVAAVYTTGASVRMEYLWTFYGCENFPGPENLTADVENVNNVVLNWSGELPPPPPGEAFFEDFEGNFPPADWAKLNPDGGTGWTELASGTTPIPGWTGGVADPAPDGGAKMAFATWETGGTSSNNQWLVTPQITVAAGDVLAFYLRYWPTTYADNVDIRISTTSQTDPAAFTIVVDELQFGATSSEDWELYTYNLTDFVSAGTPVYIGFREHVADNFNDGAAVFLDNVYVGEPTTFASAEPIPASQIAIERDLNYRENLAAMAENLVAERETTTAAAIVNPQGRKELGNSRALLYDNGPLVNSPGTGPGGSDESVLQTSLGMNTLGAGIQFALGNHMADDFVVDETWEVESFTFYGYQTNSTTTSSFTGGYLRIYDGAPNAGGTVIWGDMTTNRMTSTAWTNIYRISETTVNTARPIMEIVCETPGLTLEPGTYWVEYTLDGTLASGPWAPPVTINGQTSTGNSLQSLAGVWNEFLDSGTLTPQGLPFLIDGTSDGGGGGGEIPLEYAGANVYRNGELIAELVQGETYTDEGVEPGYYDYCVRFVYQDGAMSCEGDPCVLDVLVTENCVAPVNLTAFNPTEGQPGPQQIDLVWNEMVAQEFRYDDGIRTAQLGFNGGTINDVMGAKHNVSAEITEVSWLLSDAADGGGPHATVQLYVLGLTGAGLPDGSNVLFTGSVSNTDGVWNTHTLPNPVMADGGFFLGVAYNGFVGLGTDDGVGAPYVFQNNTHYYAVDYTAGGWATWESAGFPFSGMIRAMGVPSAVVSYAVDDYYRPEGSEFRNPAETLVYSTLDEPVAAGEPNWSQEAFYAPRAFMGYNIYKDGVLLEGLWPETNYTYTEISEGVFCYTVTAEYEFCGETDPSNEVCVSIITDIDELDVSSTARLYPNPANNSLFIEAVNMQRITIVNAIGQVVYDADANNQSKVSLNTASYDAGVYVVRIATTEGVATKRVTIVR